MADGIPCKNCGHCEADHIGGLWDSDYEKIAGTQSPEAAQEQFNKDHPELAECPGYDPEDFDEDSVAFNGLVY